MNDDNIKSFFEHNPNIKKMFDNYIKRKETKVDTIKYKWICTSDDGYKEDSEFDHNKVFDTQEEAYNDMRETAINKLFWNTDYNDVQDDCATYEEDGIVKSSGDMTSEEDNWAIHYSVDFHPHMIQHNSYSGLYTYKIVHI